MSKKITLTLILEYEPEDLQKKGVINPFSLHVDSDIYPLSLNGHEMVAMLSGWLVDIDQKVGERAFVDIMDRVAFAVEHLRYVDLNKMKSELNQVNESE